MFYKYFHSGSLTTAILITMSQFLKSHFTDTWGRISKPKVTTALDKYFFFFFFFAVFFLFRISSDWKVNSANSCLFKVNYGNTRKRCEVSSKLIMKQKYLCCELWTLLTIRAVFRNWKIQKGDTKLFWRYYWYFDQI